MTAEIAVLNKLAVALAADSAVTVSGARQSKIYNTVNKLFALSKYHPVGIMLYGGAEFMGVPWETVVKTYRGHLRSRRFDHLEQYAQHFLDYLATDTTIINPEREAAFLDTVVRGFYLSLREDITTRVQSILGEKGEVTDQQVSQVTEEIINETWAEWDEEKVPKHIPVDHSAKIITTFGKLIEAAIDEVFQKLPLSEEGRKRLAALAAGLFYKDRLTSDHTGLVIAGFGEEESYPSLYEYQLDCRVCGQLKYRPNRSTIISHDNESGITPFAQAEMVHTFMEGIDPRYKRMVAGYVGKTLAELPRRIVEGLKDLGEERKAQLVKEADEAAGTLRQKLDEAMDKLAVERFVSPVLNAVASLPKDELAAMAEALVNLTKFKRRVSMEMETVGGPIDVAIISKGDGLVWIRRKHYFEPTLNPHFVTNYFREYDTRDNASPPAEPEDADGGHAHG